MAATKNESNTRKLKVTAIVLVSFLMRGCSDIPSRTCDNWTEVCKARLDKSMCQVDSQCLWAKGMNSLRDVDAAHVKMCGVGQALKGSSMKNEGDVLLHRLASHERPEQWCGFCLDRFSYALWWFGLASGWIGPCRCVKRAHTGKPNYSAIRKHSLTWP